VSTTVWLIPAFPLVGAVLNIFFGGVIGRRAHWIAVPALAGSFLASCVLFANVVPGETLTTTLFAWIVAGDFETSVVAYIDPLTAVMLLVVTGEEHDGGERVDVGHHRRLEEIGRAHV